MYELWLLMPNVDLAAGDTTDTLRERRKEKKGHGTLKKKRSPYNITHAHARSRSLSLDRRGLLFTAVDC